MGLIVTFTDFGTAGPYLGQMHGVLHREAPGVRVIDLFADAPSFDARAAAYLLAAYATEFPEDTVFLCVVDPGVGGARLPAVVEADGRRFVGPENGLFELIARRAQDARWWEITWKPERLSASFHGRDLFAPVAARLARGDGPPGEERPVAELRRPDWPDDLAQVIYIDHFGNAMTGMRAASLPPNARLRVAGHDLGRARSFSDRAPGAAFWYENANGLAEIAVNQGSAATSLSIALAARVEILTG